MGNGRLRHLAPRLRMSGAVPPFPVCACVVCYRVTIADLTSTPARLYSWCVRIVVTAPNLLLRVGLCYRLEIDS
jgi:hypothetical protein